MPPNYDYICPECGIVETHFVKYEDRESPGIHCAACNQALKYKITMPGTTKHSYVDGQRKLNNMREAHQLSNEARKSNSTATKREIAQEITKMGVRITKE
jgi:predicted nucleic acid-binding Zn ribbon protein